MTYIAPVKAMLFAMNTFAGLDEIAGLPGNEEDSLDDVADDLIGACSPP